MAVVTFCHTDRDGWLLVSGCHGVSPEGKNMLESHPIPLFSHCRQTLRSFATVLDGVAAGGVVMRLGETKGSRIAIADRVAGAWISGVCGGANTQQKKTSQ